MLLTSRPSMVKVELESLVVDAEGTYEVCNACSRINASASRSLGDGALLASKLSRSVVTKCSPSTISDGSERGIIGRL